MKQDQMEHGVMKGGDWKGRKQRLTDNEKIICEAILKFHNCKTLLNRTYFRAFLHVLIYTFPEKRIQILGFEKNTKGTIYIN